MLSFGQNCNKKSTIKNDLLCNVLNEVKHRLILHKRHIIFLPQQARWLDSKEFISILGVQK
jgi:hypothetical protein